MNSTAEAKNRDRCVNRVYHATHIPDLTPVKAAELISRAPEFNRYAQLVNVEGIHHAKGSMDPMSDGSCTFQHLNSPADASPVISGIGRSHGSSMNLIMSTSTMICEARVNEP
jgi:hypothetical protein